MYHTERKKTKEQQKKNWGGLGIKAKFLYHPVLRFFSHAPRNEFPVALSGRMKLGFP